MDIQPDVMDKVYVTAFLSLFCSTTEQCASALWPAPRRNPRSGKAGTLFRSMAGHGDWAAMRTLILTVMMLLAHVASGADKVTQAIEKGLVTQEFLNTLTDDDVPNKWRTTTKDESNERYVKKAF